MILGIGLLIAITGILVAARYSPAAANNLVVIIQVMAILIVNGRLSKWIKKKEDDKEFNKRKLRFIKCGRVILIIFMIIFMIPSIRKSGYYVSSTISQLMN